MVRKLPHLAAFGVCLAIALAMWAGTAVFLEQQRRGIVDEAQMRRHNLARSLAEYEASSVRAIDLSLVFLRELWQRDPADFRNAVGRYEKLMRNEKVIQVAVVDGAGWLIYSHLPQPSTINFSDRAYFGVHRGRAEDAIYVSEPVFGRVTNQWAIQFSRPIRDAGGRFAGLIVMAVPPPALEEVYKDIEVGEQGVVTLVRYDGQILARSADFEKTVRTPIPTWAAIARGDALAGDFMGAGSLDGVERYFTYRKIPDYGIAVLVGQSVSSVLAPYVKQRDYVISMGVVATLFLCALAVALMLRMRDRARFAEQHENLMLELHDGCIQAIYAVGLRLQGARGLAGSDPAKVARIIAEAEADLNLVIQDLRAFIGGGRPASYSADEFLAQVQRSIPATHRAMFSVDIDAGVATTLPPEKSEHVLRIVREAASNVARHAGARSARIRLGRNDRHVQLCIDDDGSGQDGGAPAESGLGLAHIQARARKLGGNASVESRPGQGTRVTVEFPG